MSYYSLHNVASCSNVFESKSWMFEMSHTGHTYHQTYEINIFLFNHIVRGGQRWLLYLWRWTTTKGWNTVIVKYKEWNTFEVQLIVICNSRISSPQYQTSLGLYFYFIFLSINMVFFNYNIHVSFTLLFFKMLSKKISLLKYKRKYFYK